MYLNPRALVTVFLGTMTIPFAVAQLPPVPQGTETEKKVPELFVQERTIELGGVTHGDVIKVEWKLENRGEAELVIAKTVASCGCTVVNLSEADRVIPPGKSLGLKADFNTIGRKGTQLKSVVIHSNDPVNPELEVSFHAQVDVLFEMNPQQRWVLRGVRRGETPGQTLDITPGEGRRELELLGIKLKDPGLFAVRSEPLGTGAGKGYRLRITVAENAPLGYLMSELVLNLKIGDLIKDVIVPIHAEIVVDLTPIPKLVAPTLQESPPGRRLAPVVIRSTDQKPFEIRGVEAGPQLDVAYEPAADSPERTEYVFFLTIRPDALPGPFGTVLKVKTNSLSQPVVSVPVFGIVAAPLEVDPPMIALCKDGTVVGSQRRVRVQSQPQQVLELSSLKSNNPDLEIVQDGEKGIEQNHVRFLEVRLKGEWPKGMHMGEVSFTTNIAGAELVRIPVTVEIPTRSPGP